MTVPFRVEEHHALALARWPQFAGHSFAATGDGWTCDTYAVGDEWIAQFPRGAYAEGTIRKQVAVLPRLAARMPIAVPVPLARSGGDPPAMAYLRIEGEPVGDQPDGSWPEALGGALRVLHNLRAADLALSEPRIDAVKADRTARLDTFRRRVLPLMHPEERKAASALLDAGNSEGWRFLPVPTHGDLGPQHILVRPDGALAGVIDWEELGFGDPAADFAWLLHRMPAHGERALRAYGGPPDPGLRRRCVDLYLLMPLHDVLYGLDIGDQGFVEAGLRGFARRRRELPWSAQTSPLP